MRISVLKAALKLPCYLKAGGCSHPGSEQQRGARPWRMGKALGLSYTPRSAEVSFSGDRTSSEVLKAPGPVSAISMDVCFTALAQERLHTPMWWAIILHSSCRNHLLLPFHNHFGWNADLGQGLTSPLTQDSPELCPPLTAGQATPSTPFGHSRSYVGFFHLSKAVLPGQLSSGWHCVHLLSAQVNTTNLND